jgi:hypothetical protein
MITMRKQTFYEKAVLKLKNLRKQGSGYSTATQIQNSPLLQRKLIILGLKRENNRIFLL